MIMCAACAMAVAFPSEGYGSGAGSTGGTSESVGGVGGVGPSFNNSAILGNDGASCAQSNPTWTKDANECSNCCFNTVSQPCFDEIIADTMAGRTPSKTTSECESLGTECNRQCQEYLGYSPLDAPTAFLLALIAAYGAYTVYRRRILA